MDDPLFGLVVVDQMSGGKGMRQLANGWMNRESKLARRLRAVAAKALVALAVRLAPEPAESPEPQVPATPATSA